MAPKAGFAPLKRIDFHKDHIPRGLKRSGATSFVCVKNRVSERLTHSLCGAGERKTRPLYQRLSKSDLNTRHMLARALPLEESSKVTITDAVCCGNSSSYLQPSMCPLRRLVHTIQTGKLALSHGNRRTILIIIFTRTIMAPLRR